jgi:hypothetical protein
MRTKHSILERRQSYFHGGSGRPAGGGHGPVHLADKPLHDAAAQAGPDRFSIGIKALSIVRKCEVIIGADRFQRYPNMARLLCVPKT